jgi:hypothetical protein
MGKLDPDTSALSALAEEMIAERQSCHGLNHWNCARQDAGIVATTGF